MSINRRSSGIMRDIFKMLKRGELDILKVPDINFVGEEGIDAEGLTKEFCALMMTNLQKGKGGYMLFEGAPDHLVPVISEEYYQSGFFRYAGQLIAMSILHGGLGMVGLARSLATFMVTDDIELGSCHLTIEDVPDYPTQEALSEVIINFFVIYLQTLPNDWVSSKALFDSTSNFCTTVILSKRVGIFCGSFQSSQFWCKNIFLGNEKKLRFILYFTLLMIALITKVILHTS